MTDIVKDLEEFLSIWIPATEALVKEIAANTTHQYVIDEMVPLATIDGDSDGDDLEDFLRRHSRL